MPVASSRTLLLLVPILACSAPEGPEAPEPVSEGLEVTVAVPASTPAGARVYIAGSFNGWKPASPSYRLTRRSENTYGIELPSTVRGPIEFKFTLGTWERVETTENGADVPNRTFDVPEGGAAWSGAVGGWRDAGAAPARAGTRTASVSILDDAFEMPQLGRSRRVWLYLPPDYATTDRRYSVLYMHDGQNLFDDATSYVGEWGVDETLDSLHAASGFGVIVVGVDHGDTHRFDEYSPWTNAEHGGGEGDEYVDFLVHTLKPHIDASYRTLPDRLNTGIAGSSMGGLISFYAALEHPGVFGRAGVFSPAFWVAPESFAWARAKTPTRPDPRFWFVSGALEMHAGEQSGTYELGQAQMVDSLAAAGFDIGSEVVAYIRADGTHSEWFWRREFPAAVQWLFRE